MGKLIRNKYFKAWKSMLDEPVEDLFSKVEETEWTAENFRFYTAVSVISSSLNLARTGLYYEELDYEKSIPFLLMLPQSLIFEK
jgi:septation ring formation regulator EzrA